MMQSASPLGSFMSPPTAVPPVSMPPANRQPAGNIAFMMMAAARPNNGMPPPANREPTPEIEVTMDQPGRRRNSNGGIEAVIRDEGQENSPQSSETLPGLSQEQALDENEEDDEDDVGDELDSTDAMNF